ncbi:MAG TPA: malonyl-CoA decarboxylase family protein, partial [Burkholderiaceae bacterium]
ELVEKLRAVIEPLAAYYFLKAKNPRGKPVDPVARFHLGNGAALERLNWLGDTSPAGMARSAGLMVNYAYRLEEVERNHERYFDDHTVVASRVVEKLARKCPLAEAAAPAER